MATSSRVPPSLHALVQPFAPAGDEVQPPTLSLPEACAKLGAELGLGLLLLREESTRASVLLASGTGPGGQASVSAIGRALSDLEPESLRQLAYGRQSTGSIASWLPRLSASARAQIRLSLTNVGAHDALFVLAFPARDYVAALLIPVDAKGLDPRVRESLPRLRSSLERELRESVLPRELIRGWVRPSGEDFENSSGEALSRAELWCALASGCATVTPVRHPDEARRYAVFENSPLVAPSRALTDTERFVIDQTLGGVAGKCIAYAAGLTDSRISDCLATAARKLGLTTRSELLSLCAGLRLEELPSKPKPVLTDAEREVWRLLKDGLTNQEIATRRNTALRTVANQVASLLKKTGAASRRSLLVSYGAGA
ncbi:MAG: helix-turn-helix transcriptional regulator [Myxococcales bacterium]